MTSRRAFILNLATCGSVAEWTLRKGDAETARTGSPLPSNVPDILRDRLNRFGNAYNFFIAELQQGKLNIKAARHLSKLWRDVEQSGSWPELK